MSGLEWDYRLINMPSANLGGDYFVLCEVHYMGGVPHGYEVVSTITSTTIKGMRETLHYFQLALEAPVLHEDDPHVGRWDFQNNEWIGE